MTVKNSICRAVLTGLAVVVTALATVTTVQADSGTFVVGGNPINVRRSPSATGEVVAQYSPGQAIAYDSIVTGDGYRWISYVGSSGNRNYVAIGTADGSQSFGSLSGGGGSPAPEETAVDFDFARIAGTWEDGRGNRFEVTADGRKNGELHKASRVFNGKVIIGYADGRPAGGYAVSFIPAGIAESSSDSSRDRLFIPSGVYFGDIPAEEYYYRVEEAPVPTTPSQSEEKAEETPATQADLAKLVGKYKNKAGEVVEVRADGKVLREGLPADGDLQYLRPSREKAGVLSGGYESAPRFNNFFAYAPKGVDFAEPFPNYGSFGVDKDQDRLLLVPAMSTPVHKDEFMFYRLVDKEKTSATSQSSSNTKSSSGLSATKTESSAGTRLGSSTSAERGTSASPEVKANPIQTFYKALTQRQDLPSTGEAVSVLGLVGAAILGLVYYLKKGRR